MVSCPTVTDMDAVSQSRQKQWIRVMSVAEVYGRRKNNKRQERKAGRLPLQTTSAEVGSSIGTASAEGRTCMTHSQVAGHRLHVLLLLHACRLTCGSQTTAAAAATAF